jgi:SAM-dependent methyltransferase
MPDPLDELGAHLMVLAAIGRLAADGLLERPASPDDAVAGASQRLLIETGWLTAEPFGPAEALRSALPPGVPLAAAHGFVREQLGFAGRFAAGAAAGWSETDPDLIRNRGAGSAKFVVNHIFTPLLAEAPDVAERLTAVGGAFLDVGVGAAGIAIAMCHQHPGLGAVGLDVSEPALAVARHDVNAAGLDARVEVRAQSVADIDDVDAFDLLWVPQVFIPSAVLTAAMPRLRRAARPGAMLIMALSSHNETGVAALAADLNNLMAGGGTMQPPQALALLSVAGFRDAATIEVGSSSVAYARAN